MQQKTLYGKKNKRIYFIIHFFSLLEKAVK